jgi:flagellar L-ring protein precursor FlgH
MSIKTGFALAFIVGLAAGCAHEAPLLSSPAFAPVFPVDPPKQSQLTGAIFEEALSDNFFGRKRNYQVGDIITVLLDESTQAKRTQNTKTTRTSVNDALPSVQAGIGNGLSKWGVGFPGLGSAAKQIKADGNVITSDGTGDSGQLATLQGSIAVTVVEVFSNGNLSVRGEKQLVLSEGPEVIQVAGIVRVDDIAPNGTVQSKRLSNAQIAYRGSGEGADASRAGWGTRALYKYWPF